MGDVERSSWPVKVAVSRRICPPSMQTYQKHTQAEQELQELRGLEPTSPAPGNDHDEQKDDEQKDADDPAVPGHKVVLLNSL